MSSHKAKSLNVLMFYQLRDLGGQMELGELWREDRKSSHESGRRYMSL